MAVTRNKRSMLDAFAGVEKGFQEFFWDKPAAFIREIKEKTKDLPRTNFALGCDFADRGQWLDARFRFKLALWLQPNFPQAWYNLGVCQLRLGNRVEAKKAFLRTITQRPGHADAIFMLSAIDPNAVAPTQRPTRVARKNVVEFFTRVAPFYDTIAQQNQYQGGRLLFDHAKAALARTNGLRVLDLGCGTGLAARAWRSIAVTITGVDCCDAMIEQARSAKSNDVELFNTLRADDLVDMPVDALSARGYEVILLADTAQFLGDLAPLFTKCASWLAPGGVMVVTTETLPSATGYAVNPDTGRFGYHPEYVKKMAAQAGLELRKDLKVNLYAQFPAHLFVFAAKAGAA